MSHQPSQAVDRRPWPWAWLLFLALVVLEASACPAAAAPPAPTRQASPALVAGWTDLVAKPFQSVLNDRRRMIQFATIGMCVALFIMMRK